MKVFNVNMHKAWGGQPNRVLTESVELARRGHEVWVAGPRGCKLVERARERGLSVFEDLELRRGLRPGSFLRDVRTLRALFARENFDVVHTHGSQDSWVTAAALWDRGRGRPAVVRTRHNTFDIAGHLANRWLYRRVVDHVITISPQVNEYLTGKGLKDAADITPIYSAPDQGRLHPGVEAVERAEFGFDASQTVVIMVGRLAPEKGHVHLVDAAALLAEAHPEARYLFAGTGRSRREIEARIAERGMGDRIVLAGFREDVPRLLAMSDVFVLSPVDGESLGTAILEGFLMELPAVATDVGGVRESVRDGVTGFLVPPGQPEPLAEAIGKLLDDAELRRRLGRAGRAMVLEEFTPEMIAEQTEKVYEKALAHRTGSGD